MIIYPIVREPEIQSVKMHPLAKFSLQSLAIGVVIGSSFGNAAAVELTSTHADWKTYRHTQRGEMLCFAVTRASEHKPSGEDRGTPFFYVTAWPKAGIKAEVSIMLGYAPERGAEVTADISGNSFTLVADGDRAYIGNADEEQQLLDAMRRGKTMTVQGTTDSGTRSRDVFSLSGATASIQAITSSCN